MNGTTTGQQFRASQPGAAPQGRIFNHELYELAFGTLYTGLATNLMLVIACLPLVMLVITTDPASSWPVLALTSVLVAPALVAAFTVFHRYSTRNTTQVIRTFWRAWWQHLRRSLAIGATTAAVVTVATLNTHYLLGSDGTASPAVGAAAIPLQVTISLLALVTAVVALVAVPEVPHMRLRHLLRTCLLLGVRRWYLTMPSLAVAWLFVNLIAEHPAIALGVAGAPLAFALWGACRFALRPILNDTPS
ncbi:MAG: DUF624 domain-containing protein [Cellulomonadaceae bacterium]|jgi:uncharacterized membrane protein YesL|nr:DUF624 domain-containing protein [Cellulomonadaceae bacterium]